MSEEKNILAPQEDLNEILKIRREKLDKLTAEGNNPFEITSFDKTHSSLQVVRDFVDHAEGEQYQPQIVTVAGRMVSRRIMGKASFCHVMDGEGTIQLYVKRDEVGDEAYARFKSWDIGDIIGGTGEVFRTHMGEISVKVTELTLLAKSLLPLPEKFHGLKDVETRYRQRYVDLIANPDVKRTFVLRSKIIKAVRQYLDERGFLEVETPILNTIAGGANARPFITHHNTLDIDMYMRIATELHLKRLIVGGFEKVYEIGRQFRNEGMDPKHNPEFTTIELYQAYTDFHGMMDVAQGLFCYCADTVLGTRKLPYGEVVIDLDKWEKLSMLQAVHKYTGVDFSEMSADQAVAAASALGVELAEGKRTWGNALYECFDALVEKHLVQPTFIYDYPVEVSPLAKKKPSDKRLTERFEFFINCSEMGNAFSELNDPLDQYERFLAQVKAKAQGDDEAQMMDEDFITALQYGMPPTGGLGIGIDRMIMLFTNNQSIRDVLLFPTMKPLKAVNAGNCEVNNTSETALNNVKAEPQKIDFSKVEIEPLFRDSVDFETFAKSDFRAVKVLACEAVPKSKKLLKFTLDDGTGTERTILSGIHAYYEPEELIGKTCIAIVNLPPRPMMGIDSCGMLISAVHHEEGQEKLHLLMVDDHIPAGAKLY
ncbi:MAG TPA: lysine--tRNA ligase [Candidatus Fimimonas merdipullorum]|uniref:Lysine--tRNA ligase n=1 Tax=Candidatus Fimimonas merdipullorum TaxID=2840822 RepID=A0A9D1SPS4_9BACT|nr:lysine--tRNA ligase [Candidatus Fimimonas merdipullorum]